MDKKFYKYLNDIIWWCPFSKLRHIVREYFKEIEKIERENKEIINYLNVISNKIFTENDNIAVIRVSGGFADQIRIYLIAKSLEKFYNKKIVYDITWYKIYGTDDNRKNRRFFELKNIFNDIEFNLASEEQIFFAKKINYIDFYFLLENNSFAQLLESINEKKISYLDGTVLLTMNFIINPKDRTKIDISNVFKKLNYTDLNISLDKYFLPILDEKNKEIYNCIISNKNTVACHTRRTDYIGFTYYVDVKLDYYQKSFEIIKNKVNDKIKIFFFSDDLDWVKENIIPHIENIYDYKIVDININEKGYFDFYLISKCNYQISTSGNFCKIAYEFNEFKNKILITPENISSL
ncbi:alpha-1,2-fucosyltransferase [Brachyspira hyodysenteriae]|uniref:alpha-1,2-fucosyltransferase n=2 Tax=Brachyspira hyodysenteriae TaxID=159 RepID=UPI0022CD4992|nr:alpha-1,2-fucosyltransferase [Brachyspira hyodysenteriae]MCZ9839201.1 alpha-1,2-fucosyltransferase [Brachyspira hyodysenteriae]MCZ9847821.1 alpha-1,2-fucosyltransferase [Brachyspira hyodysenteriae]MCZ9851386.1 alpha-1,2-fucosyltransferase [Brachyspira hyodysenteriae]MCZ9859887.1 alpha-1,2-fucosyltransferase [Brachyspira hyodysenteriae]MCZ9870397.1 alpha-1,2-fucosyltransferase [Brachyspira hyodysenteriae]